MTNHNALVSVEARLADVPSALRFHGIDPSDLSKHGLTDGEFAYSVNSFSVGGTYYRTAPKPEWMLRPGTYYHEMCRAEATRRAWPLLRRMLQPSPYRERLDSVFKELDRELPITDEPRPRSIRAIG